MKVNLDAVVGAGDGGRQGGAAGLLHQGCAVAVLDCHVVATTGTDGMGLNIKFRELNCNNQSLLNLDDLRLPQIMRIVATDRSRKQVVW